jgi:hypothetical protein
MRKPSGCKKRHKAISQYFEKAFREFVEMFRAKLSERLAVHNGRAGALINLVRQTAADLMEITITPDRTRPSNESLTGSRLRRCVLFWACPPARLLDFCPAACARAGPDTNSRRTRKMLSCGTSLISTGRYGRISRKGCAVLSLRCLSSWAPRCRQHDRRCSLRSNGGLRG